MVGQAAALEQTEGYIDWLAWMNCASLRSARGLVGNHYGTYLSCAWW